MAAIKKDPRRVRAGRKSMKTTKLRYGKDAPRQWGLQGGSPLLKAWAAAKKKSK